MFEVRLNTAGLEHLVMTENLKITGIVIKMRLRERRRGEERRETPTNSTDTLVLHIMESFTFNLSELRISERISFNLASLTEQAITAIIYRK